MDKMRQHGEGLRFQTADNAGKSHTMAKACHYVDILGIWDPEGGLDLIQVWSSSMMASRRCKPIVPNLVNTHTKKSTIEITPKLLPLLKATL